MKNIAFLICCTGILSIFLDESFAEGSPALSGDTPAGQRDAAVLSDGEYMLTVNDYKELKEKGGLLVQYPARQKKLWEGVTFYFENRTGRKVDAVLESADGHSGTGEAVHLVRISPSFPLKPGEEWHLRRELRSDELFNGKVAVSHIGQEYTFQDDNDAAVKLVHGVLANALVSGNSRPMMPVPSTGNHLHPSSPPPYHADAGKDGSRPSSGKDEEQDEEKQGDADGPEQEPLRQEVPACSAAGTWRNAAESLAAGADIVVPAGGAARPEEGYDGAVTMEGSGDIFLESSNVSDTGNKDKYYRMDINLAGGADSRVYLGFSNSTARTAFLQGRIAGTGTLVLENTSRARVSIFDLTGADMSGFSGTLETAAPRSKMDGNGNYNTPVQVQAAGDMHSTVVDLSLIRQGGTNPGDLDNWLTSGVGTPAYVVLKLEGDLSVAGLEGDTAGGSSRVTVGNGKTATLTVDNAEDHEFKGIIGGAGADGAYHAGTADRDSYTTGKVIEADGTGIINLVKKGTGTQTLYAAHLGSLDIQNGTLRIGEGGGITLKDGFSMSSGARLDIASGASLTLNGSARASELALMSIQSSGTITFGHELVMDMEGTLELDSSVRFSHGSMLTVNAPGPDAESGISRKLVSVTDGHALSLSEGVHKEIIRYAEGKDADGNRIYRDIDVYGGITLNVQGSDRWQMLLTGLDSSSLTGTFFDTDKFTYYVWQGNAAGSTEGNVWTDGSSGSSPWEGGLTFRNGDREVCFGMKDLSGKDINSFDVYIDGTVGISSMTVTVDKAANDGLGYRFHAVAEGGGIADAGADTPGRLRKEGQGMLTLATCNTFSGGTEILEGSILAAREGALGSGSIRMADGTQLYINYPFANELDSSYRNPTISNDIQIGASSKDSARIIIGYSPMSLAERDENSENNSGYQWDYLTSRHWRTLSLTGRLSGYGELTLMGYTSTTSNGADKWASMFHISDENLPEGEKSDFSGTVKLDNYILYSTAKFSANANANNDRLDVRKPGAVQLSIEDDALRNARVDLTRGHAVNASDNGTTFEGKERMDLYHILLVRSDSVLAGLQGDLIGKTQDTEYYGGAYSIAGEVDTLRVLTNSTSTLTLDVGEADELYFAGVFGTASAYGSTSSGKVTAAGKETLSLVKAGKGSQYIHTATVRHLTLQEGTLGFNNLKVNTSAVLHGGTTLKLGVTEGVASGGVVQDWGEGMGNMTINSGYALHIVTSASREVAAGDGVIQVPETAVVNGSVSISDSAYLYFDCDILPVEQAEYPLLSITGVEGIADSGRLNLDGDVLVRFSGYNFSGTSTIDKEYYLVTTENGIFVNGSLGGFQTRTISVGGGYFGIIKITEDSMNLEITVTNTPTRTWYNGESGENDEAVAATDNVWFANTEAEGQGTDRDHWLEGLDKNLGVNGFYRDSYHVAFGGEGDGKTGAVEMDGGEEYNVVQIRGTVRPASIRVKDDVNYIFRAHAGGGMIADGPLPDDYGSSDWKTILTKDGKGTLLIETANTYSGGTEVNGGRIVMRDSSALGTGEIRMFDGTSLALDYASSGFVQQVASLNNLLTVAEDSRVTVTHTDRVVGAVISRVQGGAAANLFLQDSTDHANSVFRLDDGSGFSGTVSMGAAAGASGVVQASLAQNKWNHASFDLSLNGAKTTVLHLYPMNEGHEWSLAGVAGMDEESAITAEKSAGRDSSVTLHLSTQRQDRVYNGDMGFGRYVDMYDNGLMNDSGYISLIKTGTFSQTVGNARLAGLDIQEGIIRVAKTLFLTGELNVSENGNLVVGGGSSKNVYDYDLQVNDGGVLRLGSGFGSLSGTAYTENGVARVGNMILLNGGGTLGMLDADWSTTYEMVVDAGSADFVLDTTGYDPDTMTASGDSHVMTFNGEIKPGKTSGTISIRNDNAERNGRVVLGGANTWDGTFRVTDHAALELAHAEALNTKAGVVLQGADSRLDVKAGVVSYVSSVELKGIGASVNTLNSSSPADASVTVTARTGAGSSSVAGASFGSSGGYGIVRGGSSADRALFHGVNVDVRTGATLSHTEFSGSLLDVAAGQQAVITDMLIHAADSGIRMGEFSSLTVSSAASSVAGLNISYADGNFSMTNASTWTTNALITGTGQASLDFSGGVNLLLTECSGNLIDQLTASRVSTINFVLCDRDLLGSASNADFSTVCVLYDTALKNAGFVLDNEGTWMNDGVVTLVRPVPEPASAALGLLGLGVLLLRRRRH